MCSQPLRFQAQAEVLELEVLDELTLQVTLPEPNPAWDADFVANFAGVGSPTAIQAAIDEGVPAPVLTEPQVVNGLADQKLAEAV